MTDDHKPNEVKIAVLEEKIESLRDSVGRQIEGIREQQRAHAAENRAFNGEIKQEVAKLNAVINQGKGAYAVSLWVAGVVGAGLAAVAGYFFKKMPM